MAEKIVFVEIKETWEKDYIEPPLKGAGEILFEKDDLQTALPRLGDVTILSTFIKSRIGESEFKLLPNLKLVATRSTGFDHIDIEAAKARKIMVANVPIYGENTVAEHTFALILSLSRNLRKAYYKNKDGDFSLDGLMGFDLKGKTLGVVGTGHIGLHVIHMARGFGLDVLAFDVNKNTFLADVLGFDYVSFDELLARSDIISLHVPYMRATHHLINRENISKIKKGAILINTSRGGLIETAALVKAIDDEILSGAGLDVLEGEELILEENRLLDSVESRESWSKIQMTLNNHILLNRDNVIFTPHMAFFSKEAVIRILQTTAGNIRSFIAGTPENVVNLPKK